MACPSRHSCLYHIPYQFVSTDQRSANEHSHIDRNDWKYLQFLLSICDIYRLLWQLYWSESTNFVKRTAYSFKVIVPHKSSSRIKRQFSRSFHSFKILYISLCQCIILFPLADEWVVNSLFYCVPSIPRIESSSLSRDFPILLAKSMYVCNFDGYCWCMAIMRPCCLSMLYCSRATFITVSNFIVLEMDKICIHLLNPKQTLELWISQRCERKST